MSEEDRWTLVARRLRAAGAQTANSKTLSKHPDGCALLTLNVVVGTDGQPLLWTVSDPRLIEPTVGIDAKKAAEILATLAK